MSRFRTYLISGLAIFILLKRQLFASFKIFFIALHFWDKLNCREVACAIKAVIYINFCNRNTKQRKSQLFNYMHFSFA
ncbi:hypothetical protein BpHYR1_054382 [Brachionus plicatilis]|uniref:Uncharacterized protein n=1 Tax=Brachionus plicatilis TaxID=10195 RepID=A0A3M7QJF4_BRAPC|nr:hypothetical protein BpHYR1_054382 [Brachionus plicatilis]